MQRLLLALMLALPAVTYAQQYRTGYGSNYSGYVGVMNNVATLADNRYQWLFSPFSYALDVQNNYLQLHTPYSKYKVMRGKVPSQYLDANGVPVFEDYMLEEKINGRKKYAYVNQVIQGPSFMLNLNDRSGFALGYTVHTEVYAAGLNESLLKIFVEDRDNLNPSYDVDANQKRLMGQRFEQRNFGAGGHAYASWNLSYARVVMEDRWHFLKAGLTYRRLHGFGGGYLNIKRMDYRLNGLDTVQFINPEINYAYINDRYYSDYPAPYSFDRGTVERRTPGRGHGLNLGLVYEHRSKWNRYSYRMDGKRLEDREPNKYDYRISLALNDIGRIRYQWEYYDSATRQIIAPNSRSMSYNGTIQWNDFNESGGDIASSVDFDSLTRALFTGGSILGLEETMRLRLPMSLNVHVDYVLRPNLYLGILYTQSMRRKTVPGIRIPNMLTLQTRYEKQKWEAGGSITFGNFYNPLHLGFYARLGPWFIGSDHSGSFLSSRKTSGTSIYTGFQFHKLYKQLKDEDGDGVSDKNDRCKNEFGTLECQGCPDRDMDGVPDKDDKCPDVYGDYDYDGCPIPE